MEIKRKVMHHDRYGADDAIFAQRSGMSIFSQNKMSTESASSNGFFFQRRMSVEALSSESLFRTNAHIVG
jgi:hypothetical protein